ncbi:MAG: substrate-binding domain-containing protein [Acidobacteriota bacterium]
MKYLIPLTLFVLALTPWHKANAQKGEVTLIAPGGIREAMEQLIPGFENKSGYKVKPIFGTGLVTKKQVASGDEFDVAVVQPPYPAVIASGNALDDTASPLASSAVGVAVRKGAAKPDISTSEAVKRMLLAAESIAYPAAAIGAAAGVSFDETLKRLGIIDQVHAKIKPSKGGKDAMAMAARGEVEIGVTFMSEMDVPGIDIVGALPREISTATSFVGLISSRAKNPTAAKALLDYISSPAAMAVYKKNRMQPSR